MAVHDQLNDLIFTKLKAHYGGTNKSLNDYLALYLRDNPTFKTLLGDPVHYSKTVNEHHSDAAVRFWTAYVP